MDSRQDEVEKSGVIDLDFDKRNFLRNAKFRLYIGYSLSRWGDRMWIFALSIVLGSIGNKNLQLTAINGFLNSIVVLLFATSVGRWIDKTPRLKAATSVLIVNNSSVALSSSLLVAILFLTPDYEATNPRQYRIVYVIMVAGSIGLCALSTLASCGTKICISKDWVVVLSGKDKEALANINAWMVRMDLICMILSPLLAGQIMTSFGHATGCIYIALWNILSFFAEYLILRSVYYSCQDLSIKAVSKDKDESLFLMKGALPEQDCDDCNLPITSCVHSEDVGSLLVLSNIADKDIKTTKKTKNSAKSRVRRHSSGQSVANGFNKSVSSFLAGWRTYYRQQPVFYAGLSLALLYLTVLGFDGITTVYIYSQGLHENIVALSRGAGALVGILGTIAFPGMRKKVGLTKTGLYALGAQVTCNAIAAVSIWLPGSPFDPAAYFWGSETNVNVTSLKYFNNDTAMSTNGFFAIGTTESAANMTDILIKPMPIDRPLHSIIAFLIGIVLARFGLWMVDLTITQIMQENVADHERGVIGGVQHSLNQCLNMVKDVLVIFLPDPSTFGLLILTSCLAVFFGFLSYLAFASKSVSCQQDCKDDGINGHAEAAAPNGHLESKNCEVDESASSEFHEKDVLLGGNVPSLQSACEDTSKIGNAKEDE